MARKRTIDERLLALVLLTGLPAMPIGIVSEMAGQPTRQTIHIWATDAMVKRGAGLSASLDKIEQAWASLERRSVSHFAADLQTAVSNALIVAGGVLGDDDLFVRSLLTDGERAEIAIASDDRAHELIKAAVARIEPHLASVNSIIAASVRHIRRRRRAIA
ncbi:hypothetical protein [Azospirillum thermophilum]|uniref:Uncharacterized protein n=1 Tax=Azospirillum thermophilum TaxID=2202148 RepID=A0A2S2CT16_9PROT|nr:hypothetical protein [Azospirillum thermophilum]AWK87663.1 hypothetical protein DEW08_16865 [Azospirillum thermophilum]